MSMGYKIPDISPTKLLQVIQTDDDILVLEHSEAYTMEYVPPGMAKSSIQLLKTEDQDNSWLWATSITLTHPEVILDRILELLDSHGIQAEWITENDEGYWPEDELDEDDTTN